jgi:hypothetical protein
MGKKDDFWYRKYKEMEEEREWNETFSARLALVLIIIVPVLWGLLRPMFN